MLVGTDMNIAEIKIRVGLFTNQPVTELIEETKAFYVVKTDWLRVDLPNMFEWRLMPNGFVFSFWA